MNQGQSDEKDGENGVGEASASAGFSQAAWLLELEIAFRVALNSSLGRAANLALQLQTVGGLAFSMTGRMMGPDRAELACCAEGMRGLVGDGLNALAELQAEVGRWEAIALLYRALLDSVDDGRSDA